MHKTCAHLRPLVAPGYWTARCETAHGDFYLIYLIFIFFGGGKGGGEFIFRNVAESSMVRRIA